MVDEPQGDIYGAEVAAPAFQEIMRFALPYLGIAPADSARGGGIYPARMKRPSFSAVVSMLALFIALGGTSYAVIKLPAKSVGNRELKNNAVTGSKIRDGSIGPADLSFAGVRGPRGPEGPAGAGGTGSGAGGVGPAAAWQPLLFGGIWTNDGSGYDTAAFRADQLGMVHLRGLVTKNGALPAKDDVIGTLPPGYRPKARKIFAVGSGSPGRVDVAPNGNVIWIYGGTAEKDYTSLETISFSTD